MAEYANIINRTIGGKYVLEGRAKVVRRRGDDMAVVDFEDGYGVTDRYIDPSAQGSDVQSYIDRLNQSTTGAA